MPGESKSILAMEESGELKIFSGTFDGLKKWLSQRRATLNKNDKLDLFKQLQSNRWKRSPDQASQSRPERGYWRGPTESIRWQRPHR